MRFKIPNCYAQSGLRLLIFRIKKQSQKTESRRLNQKVVILKFVKKSLVKNLGRSLNRKS